MAEEPEKSEVVESQVLDFQEKCLVRTQRVKVRVPQNSYLLKKLL